MKHFFFLSHFCLKVFLLNKKKFKIFFRFFPLFATAIIMQKQKVRFGGKL